MLKITEKDFEAKHDICRECGQPFVLTASERYWYYTHDLTEPTRCRDCRKARRSLMFTPFSKEAGGEQ